MADLTSPQDTGTTGITPEGRGVVNVITSSRYMQCHILSESEIDGLSSMNGRCTFYVGISTALIGIAFGIMTSAAFADPKTITPMGEILGGPIVIGAFVFAFVFGIAAALEFRRCNSFVERIKRESKKQT